MSTFKKYNEFLNESMEKGSKIDKMNADALKAAKTILFKENPSLYKEYEKWRNDTLKSALDSNIFQNGFSKIYGKDVIQSIEISSFKSALDFDAQYKAFPSDSLELTLSIKTTNSMGAQPKRIQQQLNSALPKVGIEVKSILVDKKDTSKASIVYKFKGAPMPSDLRTYINDTYDSNTMPRNF